MKKTIKNIRRNYDFYSDLQNLHNLPFASRVATTDEEVLKARKLQADVYKEKGNITASQVSSSGHLDEKTDPFFSHSTYFTVVDEQNNILASSRLITEKIDEGFESLQLFARKLASGDDLAKATGSFNSSDIAEVSALVKKPHARKVTTILLYKSMYDYSKASEIKYWVMALTDYIYPSIHSLFGSALHELSEKKKLPHSNNYVYPTIVNLSELPEAMHHQVRKARGLKKKSLKNIVELMD